MFRHAKTKEEQRVEEMLISLELSLELFGPKGTVAAVRESSLPMWRPCRCREYLRHIDLHFPVIKPGWHPRRRKSGLDYYGIIQVIVSETRRFIMYEIKSKRLECGHEVRSESET